MEWWIWAAIGAAVVMLAIDWLIVMGADPKKWKGSRKP